MSTPEARMQYSPSVDTTGGGRRFDAEQKRRIEYLSQMSLGFSLLTAISQRMVDTSRDNQSAYNAFSFYKNDIMNLIGVLGSWSKLIVASTLDDNLSILETLPSNLTIIASSKLHTGSRDELIKITSETLETFQNGLSQKYSVSRDSHMQINVEMISEVLHDIRIPIAVLLGNNDIVQRIQAGDINDIEFLSMVHDLYDFLVLVPEVLSGDIKACTDEASSFLEYLRGNLAGKYRRLAPNIRALVLEAKDDDESKFRRKIQFSNITLLRVAYNVLQNIRRYAGDNVQVEMIQEIVREEGRDYLVIVIQDNGIGVMQKSVGEGFGIEKIARLITRFGATFTVGSRINSQGFMNVLKIPLLD